MKVNECDRCGKIIRDGNIARIIVASGDTEWNKQEIIFETCPFCRTEVLEFLKGRKQKMNCDRN